MRESFQASGYELVRASVNAGGGPPPRPVYAEAMTMRAAAPPPPAPPALEGGTSTLSVNVQGTIELR